MFFNTFFGKGVMLDMLTPAPEPIDVEMPTTQLETEVLRTQPRAYQIEMFEESMQRNVIVTMDTGSGKTQVRDFSLAFHRAKLRIEAELERCPPEKLVWFVAPRVVLAEQQYRYLSDQLPACSIRLICGFHEPDRWGGRVWSIILQDARIVVSTPDVLSDALNHGFIRMHTIALLVFDEAHHTVGNSPMNKVMQNHYRNVLSQDGLERVPRILGLTASPVTSAKTSSLEALERDLNAVCRAPKKHLETLQQHVPKPLIEKLTYENKVPSMPEELRKLDLAMSSFNILDDPYVKFLEEDRSPRSKQMLRKIMETKATDTLKELRKISAAAHKLNVQLGSWAAVHFLQTCLQKLLDKIQRQEQMAWLSELELAECIFLRGFFPEALGDCVHLSCSTFDAYNLSPKAISLLDRLGKAAGEDVSGIIFVTERITTSYLAQLITNHPITKGSFVAGPFVGTSEHSGRATLANHHDLKDQSAGLEAFRAGEINLMVATAVLEEGVDVPATNLVVRFDPPPNFRAFIQSRGRARQAKSTLILMYGAGDPTLHDSTWSSLEAEMKQKYMDESRAIAEQNELENAHEDYDEFLCDERTGARLSIHNIKGHLEHFCATQPPVPYTDPPRPEYILDSDVLDRYRADVVLPQGININPRRIKGTRWWASEKMAKKDAAFRAYEQLRKVGLINEHLLPVELPDPIIREFNTDAEDRSSLLTVQRRLNPWVVAAGSFHQGSCPHLLTIRHKLAEEEQYPDLHLFFPWSSKFSMNLDLFWAMDQSIKVTVQPADAPLGFTLDDRMHRVGKLTTRLLFQSIFLKKISGADGISWNAPFLMMPSLESSVLRDWIEACTAEQSLPIDKTVPLEYSLIRLRNWPKTVFPYVGQSKVYRTCEEIEVANGLPHPSNSPKKELHFVIKRLPKRLDYLRETTVRDFNTATEVIPARNCSIDRFPARYAKAMVLIPSILHGIEIRRVAVTLSKELLGPVGFSNIEVVERAICASGANERGNYQRLELIGDSILKFWTSALLCAKFPGWHEGYLARGKDKIVSNAHLSWAARKVGLAQYVHTQPFSGSQWKPPCSESVPSEIGESQRSMSKKVLADVMESLIGASFLDGQDELQSTRKVKRCLAALLPGSLTWNSPAKNASRLQELVPNLVKTRNLHPDLKEMTRYDFTMHVLLTEALTHPSYPPVSARGSYQRLEFLGDSVLDFIVVQKMARYRREIPHFIMHLIRAAVVNGHLLAYFCLGSSIEQARAEPIENASGTFEAKTVMQEKYLWQYMAHSGRPELVHAQKACVQRFEATRSEIDRALRKGTSHPWYLLISLDAPKFFSDIIESLLGAIFVDSKGNLEACKGFLERLGLMRYLDRAMDEAFDSMHPKERLGIVIGNSKIRYDTVRKMMDGKARYSSTIVMDDVPLATSAGEISRAAAETAAAEAARRTLKSIRDHDKQQMDLDDS